MGIMVLFVPVPQDMKAVHLQMRWPLQSILEAPFRLGKQGPQFWETAGEAVSTTFLCAQEFS